MANSKPVDANTQVQPWGESFRSAQKWFARHGAQLNHIVGPAGEEITEGKLQKRHVVSFDCSHEHDRNEIPKTTEESFANIVKSYDKCEKLTCQHCRRKDIGMYRTLQETLAKKGAKLLDDSSAMVDENTRMRAECERDHFYFVNSACPDINCPACHIPNKPKTVIRAGPSTKEYFEANGATFLRIDGKDGDAPLTSDYVYWVNEAGQEKRTLYKTLKYKWGTQKPSAGPCSASAFVELLEEDGYEALDTSMYVNTKSCIPVRHIVCDTNFSTSKNRFTSKGESGKYHRCPKCYRQPPVRTVVTVEDIAKICKEKGFKLVSKIYVPGQHLECICRCGLTVFITLPNLKQNSSGCKDCTRRNFAADVKKKMLEEDGIRLTSYTPETMFILNSTVLTFPCKGCGEECSHTYKSYRKGRMFCEPCVFVQREKTLFEKTGVTNPAHVPWFAEKFRETSVKNHGVTHHLKTKECLDKKHKTVMANGGYDLKSMNTPENIKKRTDNNRANHGGVLSFNTPESMQKTRDNAHRCHDVPLPSGKIAKLQGYEGFAIMDMLTFGMPGVCPKLKEKDIKYGGNVPVIKYFKDDGTPCAYHPDFMTPYGPVEVKSDYTLENNREMNDAKFFQAAINYDRFFVWIYNGNGERDRVLTYMSDGADGMIIFEDLESMRSKPKTIRRPQFPMTEKKQKEASRYSAKAAAAPPSSEEESDGESEDGPENSD